MAYAHPEAMQRLCEEVERTVWPSDRKFFRDHPRRSHRLRPAMDAEVSEHEISTGKVLPCPTGMQVFVSVRQLAPGLRSRLLFVAPAVDPWTEPSEDVCRSWHEHINPPQGQEIEQGLTSLGLTHKNAGGDP